jgi:hypothetical protein
MRHTRLALVAGLISAILVASPVAAATRYSNVVCTKGASTSSVSFKMLGPDWDTSTSGIVYFLAGRNDNSSQEGKVFTVTPSTALVDVTITVTSDAGPYGFAKISANRFVDAQHTATTAFEKSVGCR